MSLDVKPTVRGGLLQGNQFDLSKNKKKYLETIIQGVKHYGNRFTGHHISSFFSHFFFFGKKPYSPPSLAHLTLALWRKEKCYFLNQIN